MIIHPTYFPSIVNYAALVKEEHTLFEVMDFYEKQTFRNRMYIHSANGKQMLSVQVKHTHSDGRQIYKDVQISNDFDWQKQHWRSLETAYRTSPYFEFYEDDLYPIFHRKEKFLVDLNFKTIEVLNNMMDVSFTVEKTTNFVKDYQEIKDYRSLINAKKPVSMMEKLPKYTQMFDDRNAFMPNLSVLDLLFMEGPNAITYLEAIPLNEL